MQRTQLIAALAASLMLHACASVDLNENALMFNTTEVTQSKFDGSTTYRVNNISCPPLLFDVFYKSNTQPDMVALIAKHGHITSIGDGQSLKFNIDGKTTAWSSADKITRHNQEYVSADHAYQVTRNTSSKAYIVPLDLISQLATAQRVAVRLHGLDEYTDALCSTDTSFRAELIQAGITPPRESQSSQTGFKKFLSLIQK